MILSFCRKVRLSPSAVNEEVTLLESLSGEDDSTPLLDIQFTSS